MFDLVDLGEAVGPATFLTWKQFLAGMHMHLANLRPDVALTLELAPYKTVPGNGAKTGMFLLPGKNDSRAANGDIGLGLHVG